MTQHTISYFKTIFTPLKYSKFWDIHLMILHMPYEYWFSISTWLVIRLPIPKQSKSYAPFSSFHFCRIIVGIAELECNSSPYLAHFLHVSLVRWSPKRTSSKSSESRCPQIGQNSAGIFWHVHFSNYVGLH